MEAYPVHPSDDLYAAFDAIFHRHFDKLIEIVTATPDLIRMHDVWDDHETLLHKACDCGESRMALYLIQQGADVNSRDKDLMTPLMVSAAKSDQDTVRFLIGAGADVNLRNDTQETALHFAAGRGNVAIVSLLVASGAERDAVDDLGWTPADNAEKVLGNLKAAYAKVSNIMNSSSQT